MLTRFRIFILASLVSLLLVALPVLAQDQTPPADDHSMTTAGGVCLLIGSGISFLITILKTKIAFIDQYPKLVALVLSTVIAAAEPFIMGYLSSKPALASFSGIALCTFTQLAAAIGTHEAITRQVKKVTTDG